jgi:hypothetical protein
MSAPNHFNSAAERIPIEGDELLRDDVFHKEVFGGANRRTGKRAEIHGLPFVLIRGIKYRPLREGKERLAGQIRRPKPLRRRA